MHIGPELNPAQIFRATLLPGICCLQFCWIDVFWQQIDIIRCVARPIHLVHAIDLAHYSTAGAVVYQDVGFCEINRRGHLLHEQVGILTEELLRAGMSRDHVKWIRGDAMKESIDIYYHIDVEDVRKSYMAYVPQLGI